MREGTNPWKMLDINVQAAKQSNDRSLIYYGLLQRLEPSLYYASPKNIANIFGNLALLEIDRERLKQKGFDDLLIVAATWHCFTTETDEGLLDIEPEHVARMLNGLSYLNMTADKLRKQDGLGMLSSAVPMIVNAVNYAFTKKDKDGSFLIKPKELETILKGLTKTEIPSAELTQFGLDDQLLGNVVWYCARHPENDDATRSEINKSLRNLSFDDLEIDYPPQYVSPTIVSKGDGAVNNVYGCRTNPELPER